MRCYSYFCEFCNTLDKFYITDILRAINYFYVKLLIFMIMKKDEQKLSWLKKLKLRFLGIKPQNTQELSYALDVWDDKKIISQYHSFCKLSVDELKILLLPKNRKKFLKIFEEVKPSSHCFDELLRETNDEEVISTLLKVNYSFSDDEYRRSIEDFVIANHEKYMKVFTEKNHILAYTLANLLVEGKYDALFSYIYYRAYSVSGMPELIHNIITSSTENCNRLCDTFIKVAKENKGDCSYLFTPEIVKTIIKRGKTEDILLLFDEMDGSLDEEECEILLKSENSEAVLAYVKSLKNGCCINCDDVELVKPCYKEALKVYLEQHYLSDNAEVLLAKMNDEELLLLHFNQLQLADIRPCDKAFHIIVNCGNDKLKQEFIERFGLPYFAERQLILRGRYMDIRVVSYVKDYQLYSGCEILLIQKCPLDIIKLYLKDSTLGENAEAVLLQSGSDELFDWYMKNNPKLYWDNVIFFIKRANSEKVYSWLTDNNIKLSPHAQAEIMKLDDNKLTKLIDVDAEAELMFIKTGSKEAIMTYISEFTLEEAAEVALVQRCDEDLILALMEKDGFYNATDKVLLQLYIEDKISYNVVKRYIELYSFSDEVEELFFGTDHSCADLKEFYISQHGISDKALISLLNTDEKGDLILLCIRNGKFGSSEAEYLLLEHKNPHLWLYYIERYQPNIEVERKALKLS